MTLKLDDSISSNIQEIHFNKDVTSALFQLTGHHEGVYTLSFELSGAAMEYFEVPSPLIILVKDSSNIDLAISGNSTLLSPGCCEQSVPHYCSSTVLTEQSILLTSSCEWGNQQIFLTTSGMTHVQTGGFHLPLSVAGLEVVSEDDGSIHSSMLPSSLSTCGSCSDSCHSHIPSIDDFLPFIVENTLKQTFINTSLHFVPDLYSVSIEADADPVNIVYTQYDFMNYFGRGWDLLDRGLCSSLSLFQDDLYAVTVIDSPVSLMYGDSIFTYTPVTSLCVAVELSCNGLPNDVLLNVPIGLSNLFKESLLEKVSANDYY